MAYRPLFDDTYLLDLKTLRERGMTIAEAASELGMSERTAYRVLAQGRASRRERRVVT